MNALTLDTSVLAKGIIPPRRRKKDLIYAEQFRLFTLARSILQDAAMNVPSVALIEIAAVAARLTGKEDRGCRLRNMSGSMQAYCMTRLS